MNIEKHISSISIEQTIEKEKGRFMQAKPFPHMVIDDFLIQDIAEAALKDFPDVTDAGWIHYIHFNEKKHGLNKVELLPTTFQELIKSLNSPKFVSYLSDLTGIKNLIADPQLEGGGLHQSSKGGFLNIHADFTVHPHKRKWRRRVNLLIYFNKNWQKEFKGELELWDNKMKSCEQKIEPIFNRCVIFETSEDSYHGFPDAINFPEGDSRKSLALYYFTEEKLVPLKRATNYRARPGDGIKAIFIYLDKMVLSSYNKIKGILGINDDFVSNILKRFNRK